MMWPVQALQPAPVKYCENRGPLASRRRLYPLYISVMAWLGRCLLALVSYQCE